MVSRLSRIYYFKKNIVDDTGLAVNLEHIISLGTRHFFRSRPFGVGGKSLETSQL